MSAPIAALIVRVAADLSELRGGVDQVNSKLDSLGSSAKNVGIALASAFSAQQIIGFAKDAAASFAAEEAAVKQLTTALEAQGSATPEVIGQYAAMAAEFQKTSVNSDELVTEMQALLVQVGGVMPDQMKGALRAAADLSAGLGIDLKTATMLVGKAFAGETGTLKRYGIVIDESALKTDAAAAVMDAINSKFGGQSQAQIDTYAGKMKVLGNQIDDIKEVIGSAIATVLTPLLNIFIDLPQSVQAVVVVLAGLVSAAAPVVVATMGISGAFTALLPFLGPIGWIAAGVIAIVTAWRNWDAIVGFVKAVYNAVKEFMVDRFNAIVDSIKAKVDAVTGFFKDMYEKVVGSSFVPDMITRIGQEFDKLQGVMVDPASGAMGRVTDLFGQGLDAVGQVMALFKDKTRTVTDNVVNYFQGMGQQTNGILRVMAGDMTGWKDIVVGTINQVMSAIGLVKSLVNHFRGGEEGIHVNPARDAFIGQFGPGGTGPGSGFFNLAALLTDQGRGDLFNALRTSDTMAEFNAAVSAINAFLQGGGSQAGAGGGGGGGDQTFNVYIGDEQLDARTVRVTRQAMVQGEIPVPESSISMNPSYA